MRLFHETGAFFSGVVLARHKIAQFISEELKPLRDFFLVLFFFTLGAHLDLLAIRHLFLVSILLASFFVLVRPWFFERFFAWSGETPGFSREAGIRLGQLSEFALLVALLGLELGHISRQAALLIQVVTIITFVASSYYVFYNYPTPIGLSGKMMKT